LPLACDNFPFVRFGQAQTVRLSADRFALARKKTRARMAQQAKRIYIRRDVNMQDEIICYCSNISKQKILGAIQQGGAKTLQDIRDVTSACTLGRCKEFSPTKKCCSTDIVKILRENVVATYEDASFNSGFDFSKAGKYKAISSEAKVARFSLIDYVIETKNVITLEKATEIVGEDVLTELLEKHIVNLNQNNEISHLYPVSAIETGHSVKLDDGRQFHTMCAIDSLGCPSTFHIGCEIFSFCSDTDKSVYMKITEQGIETALPTTNLFISYIDNVGEASCNCCGMMSFFQHETNALDSLKEYGKDGKTYLWTLNDAFHAAKMMFDN
jgi:bacterioferritin-associated ferredoxin